MRHAVRVLILLVAALRPAAGEPVTGTPASIPAPDGTKLAATYYSSAISRDPASFFSTSATRTGPLEHPRRGARREGFHVLTVDYRGYGESGGNRHLDLPDAERR